ncbi:MAG: glycyl-radical enzyme activating protein [Lachnospiraceae bacterium]|nr:glycyl-radical enzyme activating protein [Lachnospiraceae bacterium]
MLTGTIFDIKEFAVFDGPGMRQTVFFKGCPLRCSWCHNPEGLCMQPQLMVSHASCTDCGRCRAVCQHETCIACGACVAVCPLRLRKIAGEAVSSEELVRRIRKNASYYARYGGGVTFSGGEPFMQHAFLLEVLKQIPDLHRAIETSGFCDQAVFEEVVRHLDYVMMDLKIFDEEKHLRYTGVSNQKILENARQLCSSDTPFVIRIPVIPGVNDNEENYRATAEFLQGAKALQKVELLPYHKTAGAKYSMLGMEYQPDFDPEAAVQTSAKLFAEYGIACEVL